MKNVYYIFIAIVLFSSCAKKETDLSPAQIKFKADSIITIRLDELNKQYTEDLEKRMVVEVKGKADSIVDATMRKNRPDIDTVKLVNKMDMGTRPNPLRLDTTRKHPITKEP
jgi:hypothetical protein